MSARLNRPGKPAERQVIPSSLSTDQSSTPASETPFISQELVRVLRSAFPVTVVAGMSLRDYDHMVGQQMVISFLEAQLNQ